MAKLRFAAGASPVTAAEKEKKGPFLTFCLTLTLGVIVEENCEELFKGCSLGYSVTALRVLLWPLVLWISRRGGW